MYIHVSANDLNSLKDTCLFYARQNKLVKIKEQEQKWTTVHTEYRVYYVEKKNWLTDGE